MSIKTITNLLKFTDFKITSKKVFNYFSIFTIVLGTSFGSLSSANAAALTLTQNSTNASNGVNGDTTLAVDGTDTVSMGDFTLAITGLDGTATAFSIGAVTGLSADGTTELELNFQEDGASVAQEITVASVILTADSDTAGVLDINFADAAGVSGTATFTGEVDTGTFGTTLGLIDIDMADSSATTPVATIQFGGDVTGTTTLDEGAEDITIILNGTAAQTYTGTINSNGGDGEGNLRVTNTTGVTFATAVGKAGSGALGTIDINGATTFDAASEAMIVTVDADTTFTGALTANTSTAIATSGTDVTLSAASNTGTTTLASGTTLTADGVLTTGDLTNTSGKVYLNAASNVVDNIIIAGTGELHIGKAFVTTNNINTSSTSDGEGNFASTGKIYLPSNLTSGETLTITDSGAFDEGDADKTAITTAAAVNTILQDTALVDYSASAASAGATVITITATDRTTSAVATQLSTTTNNATAALKLMTVLDDHDTSGDTAAFTAFDNALKAQAGYGATEDTDFIDQTAPQTDLISGSTVAAQAVTGSVQGIMSSRMASLRSGDAYFGTGVAAGGMSAQSGFIHVFGSNAVQKSTTVGSGTQAGYESDSQGIAIGFDGVTDNGMTVGISLASANTDVDGKGKGKSTNSIDTYSASIYMDMATDSGYVEGSVTYGINENTSSRKVTAAGLSRTYSGSYDSDTLSFNITAGSPNEVGNGYLTPFGSLTVTNIDTDSYTETSTVTNDALRLKVDQGDITSTVGTVGVKYHTEMSNGGTPMISLALNNELGDNTIDTTNTYQGGGTAFTTSTAVEELSATLGLGYSYGSDSSSIEIAYEADVNDDDYLSHYGSIKIVGKF
jgi:uncharacterized protein with beta-barrel porin domain